MVIGTEKFNEMEWSFLHHTNYHINVGLINLSTL